MSKKFESKSFGITFRPRLGLSSATEERLLNWVKKQDYGHLYIEKEGCERHAHIQVWSDDFMKRDSVQKAMNRILVDTVEFDDLKDKREQLSAAIKVKMMYNDWLRNYCEDNRDKNDDSFSDSVFESLPVDTTDYYPSQEEQEFIEAKANAVDNYMFKLEQKFLETELDPSKENIAEFLSDIMFNKREVQTMRKQIDRINLCNTLYNYVNKIIDKKLFLSKEEQITEEEKTEIEYGKLEEKVSKKLGLDVDIFRKKMDNYIID